MIKALRGGRSQTAFSRHLGFKCNVLYTWESGRRWPTEWLFLGLVLLLVVLSVSALVPEVMVWFPGGQTAQVWGGLLLIGMGLVHLGVASRGLRVIISLLTTLSGFEILYAVVESSTLVAGLLAVVTLGIALTGAYLLAINPEEVLDQ